MSNSKCMSESKAARNQPYELKVLPVTEGYYWCRPYRSSKESTIIEVRLIADDDDSVEELGVVTTPYEWMSLNDIHIWGPKIEQWAPA